MFARKQGISLVEVLVSLVLISGSAFVLLKKQAECQVWMHGVQILAPVRAHQ